MTADIIKYFSNVLILYLMLHTVCVDIMYLPNKTVYQQIFIIVIFYLSIYRLLPVINIQGLISGKYIA